jgi:hypothetical protein
VRHPADGVPAVGWLGSKIPGLQATHSGGHLFNDLIGWGGDQQLPVGALMVTMGLGYDEAIELIGLTRQ